MSYDESDAARDQMYEEIARELYPDHKAQAITEFTSERLQSFYVANPLVMRSAVDAIQEGRRLQANDHHSAALVFFVTAIELLLKATLLKPVVHGLVHSEGLAEIIVQQALGQAGFDRYSKLLTKLFAELVSLDINTVARSNSPDTLLSECTTLQALRNRVIHQGATANASEADLARVVAVAVYEQIVHPMLRHLGLHVVEHGEIVRDDA
ncbi:hypothetical protein A1353_12245 [Methylomonas methanica]|uniref:RiboL-PSP-HEPN domain-containing protein n=1 Tax=Methylomonas methanica TaxID=421 RepID=A0A177MGN5_METMH|nr:hypothetical protein [Methylomonas methanica]OAI04948.1 hypothetical protein A1353_12245 [Methylomonas methanica]